MGSWDFTASCALGGGAATGTTRKRPGAPCLHLVGVEAAARVAGSCRPMWPLRGTYVASHGPQAREAGSY